MSTVAFTVCFAVWTIFSIIGVGIKDDLGLTETQFGLLVGTPILTGSLVRMLLGIWTDRYGGRLVFTAHDARRPPLATFLLSYAETYPQMLAAALGVGMAGGSFAVGVAYVSRFFPAERQGTALGIFGVGNVGAAVTKFLAPFALVAWGWEAVAQAWAAALAVMAVVFWLTTGDDPVTRSRRAGQVQPPEASRSELAAAEEPAGLALRPLLLLRLRRLRGARPLAAALPDRRLRLRHQDRGHDRRRSTRSPPRSSAPMAACSPTRPAPARSCTGPSPSRRSAR